MIRVVDKHALLITAIMIVLFFLIFFEQILLINVKLFIEVKHVSTFICWEMGQVIFQIKF